MDANEIVPYVKQFIELEDSVMIKLNEFLGQILKTSTVDEDLKNEIKEKLSILCEDGQKHQKLVYEIQDYVERSGRDEF